MRSPGSAFKRKSRRKGKEQEQEQEQEQRPVQTAPPQTSIETPADVNNDLIAEEPAVNQQEVLDAFLEECKRSRDALRPVSSVRASLDVAGTLIRSLEQSISSVSEQSSRISGATLRQECITDTVLLKLDKIEGLILVATLASLEQAACSIEEIADDADGGLQMRLDDLRTQAIGSVIDQLAEGAFSAEEDVHAAKELLNKLNTIRCCSR